MNFFGFFVIYKNNRAHKENDNYMNIFDILGPVMVGPSSSHTAGAVRIGLLTKTLLGSRPIKAEIGLHGSFGDTGKGHGTDRAIVAGLLGMKPDDTRIPDSFSIAEEEGLSFTIGTAHIPGAHPNTALLKVEGENKNLLEVQASSLGGGRIMINKLDGITVNCTGECPTLIVHNLDQPGHVAEVTSTLAHKSVNIATMQLYRDKRGGYAVMVVETDQPVPVDAVKWLEHLEGVIKVTYINGEE
ncbi:L-serine ammonia-lyase, iron-sulfur-dependent subunit beta [Lactonifactor longoviformis]